MRIWPEYAVLATSGDVQRVHIPAESGRLARFLSWSSLDLTASWPSVERPPTAAIAVFWPNGRGPIAVLIGIGRPQPAVEQPPTAAIAIF